MKSNMNYALQNVNQFIEKEFYNHLVDAERKIKDIRGDNILVIDSTLENESPFEFARELKKSGLKTKILLLISSGVSRTDIIGAIKDGVVSGALLMPFTAKQMEDYINRL
jgi:DNA-binding NtrC family response regulator